MIFLSHVMSKNSPRYGDGGHVSFEPSGQLCCGDSANCTDLAFPAHFGTHIDSPYHFDDAGKKTEEYPADFWMCNHPFLIDYPVEKEEIFTLDKWKPLLESIPQETDFLIIKTGFEQYRPPEVLETDKSYIFHGPGVGPDVGKWLRENRKLKMIGFDFISLSSYSNRMLGREAHRAFLNCREDDAPTLAPPILIVEDMKLSGLTQSPSKVIVAPILHENSNGGPVTVFAEVEG